MQRDTKTTEAPDMAADKTDSSQGEIQPLGDEVSVAKDQREDADTAPVMDDDNGTSHHSDDAESQSAQITENDLGTSLSPNGAVTKAPKTDRARPVRQKRKPDRFNPSFRVMPITVSDGTDTVPMSARATQGTGGEGASQSFQIAAKRAINKVLPKWFLSKISTESSSRNLHERTPTGEEK